MTSVRCPKDTRGGAANHKRALLIPAKLRDRTREHTPKNLEFPLLLSSIDTIHTSDISKKEGNRTVARMTGHPSVFTSQVRTLCFREPLIAAPLFDSLLDFFFFLMPTAQ